MKLLLTALLLLSTPLLAQTPRGQTARKYNCDADHYALGRPTTEEIQRRFGTKTVPAVEYHACKSADTVKVASEGGAIDDMEINQQFVTTFLALTSRIEALEEHLASETARIDGNLQRLNDKLSTVNVRPAYVQPAQQAELREHVVHKLAHCGSYAKEFLTDFLKKLDAQDAAGGGE